MIKMSEYAKRRKQLMQEIGPDAIVVLPAANECLRNGDAHYPYRQNSDFYYLTGFKEPEAVMVLAPKRKDGEYILFNRVRDAASEIWDGPRAGQLGARKKFLADQAFPIDQLEKMLPDLLAGRKTIHYPLGLNMSFDRTILRAVNSLRKKVRSGMESPITFVDVVPSIHEMRLFKSPAEIDLMQKAVAITACGHVAAMRICQPSMSEAELDAIISYEFIRLGSQQPAYTSIVGSGKNSCILHYINNNRMMANGELVLIDAGAEYENYAADISRTFPVNGKFSAEQRAIYEIVLAAQLAAIKTIKPGASWNKAQEVIVKIITQGLVDVGILKGRVPDLIERQAYVPFYMHRSGHWLGLDVHDAGRYRDGAGWRKLRAGMVLTVEPGIYIAANSNVHKRWHNIGIRIEDDVLVTQRGCRVLSDGIPKTIDDIEAVMG